MIPSPCGAPSRPLNIGLCRGAKPLVPVLSLTKDREFCWCPSDILVGWDNYPVKHQARRHGRLPHRSSDLCSSARASSSASPSAAEVPISSGVTKSRLSASLWMREMSSDTKNTAGIPTARNDAWSLVAPSIGRPCLDRQPVHLAQTKHLVYKLRVAEQLDGISGAQGIEVQHGNDGAPLPLGQGVNVGSGCRKGPAPRSRGP